MLAKEHVAKYLVPGTHGTTFGGSPLACSAGNAVLDVLLAPGFLDGVAAKGERLARGLDAIGADFPAMFEGRRGRGLMQGLKCSVPAGEVQTGCYAEGLMIATAGENVIRLMPALVVTDSDIDTALGMLRAACAKLGARLGAKAAAE